MVAVVGHTNTGKTSLLRTLTRDIAFGEVSPRPAVTRHVEGTALLVDGQPRLELYDTPGLEDSIGLLDHLDRLQRDRREEGVVVIERFLGSAAARRQFTQEAKALRQVLASGVALYVIDARDPVRAKHRDELEVLRRCARPIVPVLNFVASAEARTETWRQHLSRAGLHAVAEFDTVVFDEEGEIRLFEKMRSLLDAHRETLTDLIRDRRSQRATLVRDSARRLAEMLVDAAACVVTAPAGDAQAANEAVDELRRRIRTCEQSCVDDLLALHRFGPDDCAPDALPITDGRWGTDLFSPEALRVFGLRAGGGAAAGAVAGMAVDAMFAGLSLGAATATGAAIGALWSTGQLHGRRLLDRMRGLSELRCDDNTLRILAARQVMLVRALLRRGHATQERLDVGHAAAAAAGRLGRLARPLLRARSHPAWSRLSDDRAAAPAPSPTRDAAVRDLATGLQPVLLSAPDEPISLP
jgi:hypothetical protein